MIQFKEIVLTAKHLQNNIFRENAYLLLACFWILYLEKICISCTKYVLLNNILFTTKIIVFQN